MGRGPLPHRVVCNAKKAEGGEERSSSSCDDSGPAGSSILKYSTLPGPLSFFVHVFLELDHSLVCPACSRVYASDSATVQQHRLYPVASPHGAPETRITAVEHPAPATHAASPSRDAEARVDEEKEDGGAVVGVIEAVRLYSGRLAQTSRTSWSHPDCGGGAEPLHCDRVRVPSDFSPPSAVMSVDAVCRPAGLLNSFAAPQVAAPLESLLHQVLLSAIETEATVRQLRRVVRRCTANPDDGLVSEQLIRRHRSKSTTSSSTARNGNLLSLSSHPPELPTTFASVSLKWWQHQGSIDREERDRSLQYHKQISHLVEDSARYTLHVLHAIESSTALKDRAEGSSETGRPRRESLLALSTAQPLYQLLPPPLFRHTSFTEETSRLLRWLQTWDQSAFTPNVGDAGGQKFTTAKLQGKSAETPAEGSTLNGVGERRQRLPRGSPENMPLFPGVAGERKIRHQTSAATHGASSSSGPSSDVTNGSASETAAKDEDSSSSVSSISSPATASSRSSSRGVPRHRGSGRKRRRELHNPRKRGRSHSHMSGGTLNVANGRVAPAAPEKCSSGRSRKVCAAPTSSLRKVTASASAPPQAPPVDPDGSSSGSTSCSSVCSVSDDDVVMVRRIEGRRLGHEKSVQSHKGVRHATRMRDPGTSDTGPSSASPPWPPAASPSHPTSHEPLAAVATGWTAAYASEWLRQLSVDICDHDGDPPQASATPTWALAASAVDHGIDSPRARLESLSADGAEGSDEQDAKLGGVPASCAEVRTTLPDQDPGMAGAPPSWTSTALDCPHIRDPSSRGQGTAPPVHLLAAPAKFTGTSVQGSFTCNDKARLEALMESSVVNSVGGEAPSTVVAPGVSKPKSGGRTTMAVIEPADLPRALCFDANGNRFSIRLAEKDAREREQLAKADRERRLQKGYFGQSRATAAESPSGASSGSSWKCSGLSASPAPLHARGRDSASLPWSSASTIPSGLPVFYDGPPGSSDITNIAVLGGLCGVGKTAAVYLAAQLLSFRVIEMNHGVRRTPKSIATLLAEVTQSKRIHGLQMLASSVKLRGAAGGGAAAGVGAFGLLGPRRGHLGDSLIDACEASVQPLGAQPLPGVPPSRGLCSVEQLLAQAKESQQAAKRERQRRLVMASPLAVLFHKKASQNGTHRGDVDSALSAAPAEGKITGSTSSTAEAPPKQQPVNSTPTATDPPLQPSGGGRADGLVKKPKKSNGISSAAIARFFKQQPLDSKHTCSPTSAVGSRSPFCSGEASDEAPAAATPVPSPVPEPANIINGAVGQPMTEEVSPKRAVQVQVECEAEAGTSLPIPRGPPIAEGITQSAEAFPLAYDAHGGKTLILFESADVVLDDESARAFYASIRDLAQKSKVPILVTAGRNEPESTLRSAAQVLQQFGKGTPLAPLEGLPLHYMYMEILVLAAVELGLLQQRREEPQGAASARSSQHPCSQLNLVDRAALVQVSRHLLWWVFFGRATAVSLTVAGVNAAKSVADGRDECSSLGAEFLQTTHRIHRPLSDCDARQWLNAFQWWMLPAVTEAVPAPEPGRLPHPESPLPSAVSCASRAVHACVALVGQGARVPTSALTQKEASTDVPADWMEVLASRSEWDARCGRVIAGKEDYALNRHHPYRRVRPHFHQSGLTQLQCPAESAFGKECFMPGPREDVAAEGTVVLPREKDHRVAAAASHSEAAPPRRTAPALAAPGAAWRDMRGGPLYGAFSAQQMWELHHFQLTLDARAEVVADVPYLAPPRWEHRLTPPKEAKRTCGNSLSRSTNSSLDFSTAVGGGSGARNVVGPPHALARDRGDVLPVQHALWGGNRSTQVASEAEMLVKQQSSVRLQELLYLHNAHRRLNFYAGDDSSPRGETGSPGVDAMRVLLGEAGVGDLEDSLVAVALPPHRAPLAEAEKVRCLQLRCIELQQRQRAVLMSCLRDSASFSSAGVARGPDLGTGGEREPALGASTGLCIPNTLHQTPQRGALAPPPGTATPTPPPGLEVASLVKVCAATSARWRQRLPEIFTWRWKRKTKRAETLKGLLSRSPKVYEDTVAFACLLSAEPPLPTPAP